MRVPLLSCFVVLWLSSLAHAQSLRVDASAERMRVDGALREWKGARFAQFGSGSDAAFRVALATADGGLYVGADVTDDQLVREGGAGARQDALVLTLVMPEAGGTFESVEVWLYPGAPGKKAVAGLAREGQRPKSEPRVKIVEGPSESGAGYVLEAFIPWAIVPGSEIWEQGRAALRFEDVDGGKVENVVRTATAKRPSELPRIVLGDGHQDLLGAFLSSQSLSGVEPRFDFRGNVTGDRTPERVVIVDRFVVVYGPKFKKGEAFGYMQLALGTGGGLKSATLEDVTGDGLDELLLVLRQKNDLGTRELWQVVSFASEDPKPIFGIELKKELRGGAFIENKLALVKSKGPMLIRQQAGSAQGVDASSYHESPPSDVGAILLPWGDVEARAYRFDGTRFAVVEEKKRAPAPPEQASHTHGTSSSASAQGEASEEPVEPSVENVLALFKKERKIPKNAAPTKQLTGNLFAGPLREHLFVFGTTLVVLGGDLGDGGSYLAYGLPIQNPDDFLYVGSGDVTGDGVREIFVRVKQVLSGAESVHRELVLVLRFDSLGRFGRALAADVTRRKGPQVIANRVRTYGGKLTILPGTAEGWDASNYPFTNEATGGAERLLLPWADKPVNYRLEGDRFVAN
jgi:hypothetical protein